jgi:hypothetical protein
MKKKYCRNDEIACVEEDGLFVVLVPNTGVMHEFNEVAAAVWRKIPENGAGSVEIITIVDAVCIEYEADRDIVFNDVDAFLQELVSKEIIIETS